MKKNLFFASIFIVTILACSKKTPTRNGYNITTVYSNTLTIPVSLQFGHINNKDTIFQTEKYNIQAGKTYETTQFFCQNDCGPSSLSIIYLPRIIKIYIAGKVKTDFQCISMNSQQLEDCKKDAVNVFDDNRWIIQKGKFGDIVKTYSIDKADSLEAK